MSGASLLRRLVLLAPFLPFAGMPARAQDKHADASQTATPSSEPNWVATASIGVSQRKGDAAQPYYAAGLSRRIGRGYVRAAVTSYRSVVRQADAVLPSRFTLGSVGFGGRFGQWFIDGYGSAGRQHYTGVTTALGVRESQVGSGSAVWGAGLSGGRYIRLSGRLYLTPSAALQYSANKALRQTIGPMGPQDVETDQRALTGSATVRLDRYFGKDDRHLAGVSITRVQSTNGATALASVAGGGPGPPTVDLRSVPDGWFVAGLSASLRLSRQLWIDTVATRTFDARSGTYSAASVGLRRTF
jgi:hypothetical protein